MTQIDADPVPTAQRGRLKPGRPCKAAAPKRNDRLWERLSERERMFAEVERTSPRWCHRGTYAG